MALVVALLATVSTSLLAAPGPAAAAGDPAVVPLQPTRVWDSRPGAPRGTSSLPPGLMVPGRTVAIPVRSVPGLPGGARALIANVTATAVAQPGFVTVWPCGSRRPNTSNLNIAPGEDTANQVTVALDATGRICAAASAPTHLVVDAGAYVPGSSPVKVFSPFRAIDTRTVRSLPAGVAAGGALRVPVGGQRSIPAAGGLALVNITSTASAAQGYFTAYPCDAGPPTASVLNYLAGENRANAAWVKLDGSGAFCVRPASRSHVVVDVVGVAPLGSPGVVPVVPNRVVDTRFAIGVPRAVAAGATAAFGVPGLTDTQAYRGALLLNVTVAGQTSAGYLTLWPCGAAVPRTSSLNFAAGRNRANSVSIAPGADGRICIRSSAPTQVVVDLGGYVDPPGRRYTFTPITMSDGMTPVERSLVAATNAARATGRTCGPYGYFRAAAPLVPNGLLAIAARSHAGDMASRNFFSHTGSDNSRVGDRVRRVGYAWAAAGENLAAGFADAPAAVAALLRSPDHCRNIMDPAFTQLGVGYAFSTASSLRYYWAQTYARPR